MKAVYFQQHGGPEELRMGDVDDICQTAVWLIEQASFTTGQVIAVDGGRLLR